MKAKLILYLYGSFFAEKEITLPTLKHFKKNVDIRHDFIKNETTQLKLDNIRQILKCQNNYEIFLIVESKSLIK